MYNKLKVTYPNNFARFKCIGGECEDTCCQGWDIEIDKDTFDEYLKVQDQKMKAMLSDNIKKNNYCTSDDLDYGIIKLNEDKKCPFLDKCNYCSIYTAIGEAYLSNICTQFPRILNKINNEYEISLDVSCLEAAKIMLQSEDKISFNSSEQVFEKYIINDEYNTNSKKYKKSPIKYLKEIRAFSMEIMQDRNYPLSERLYILGDFIMTLEEKMEEDYKLAHSFIKDYDRENIAQKYKKNNMDYIFQIIFFKSIIEFSNIREQAISDDFKKYTDEVLDGFNINDIDNCGNDEERYISIFQEYNKNFIKKYEYIFENYLVNYMYNNLFPFTESDDMLEGYIMLVVRYSFIRFYLVGRYISSRQESSENIIKLISLFARDIEHDKTYMSEIYDYIEKNQYDNMNFANKLL